MHAIIFSFLLLTSIFLSTQASNEDYNPKKCSPEAPEIRLPFRVKPQQSCGHPGFDLDCKNNTTSIHFPGFGDLIVKSISYDIKKVDLVDPKSCVHGVFLNLNLSQTPFQYYYVVKNYSYLNCSVRLSSNSFREVPCLSGSGYHVYTQKPSRAVPNSCRVVKTVPIPFEYSPYLADNSFGLGLTWNDVLGYEDSQKARKAVLQTTTEQEPDCFTMAHVKVCTAIIIFLAAVVIVRVANMRQFRKLHHHKEGGDQLQAEKLLGMFKANKLETVYDDADLKRSSCRYEIIVDLDHEESECAG